MSEKKPRSSQDIILLGAQFSMANKWSFSNKYDNFDNKWSFSNKYDNFDNNLRCFWRENTQLSIL